MKKGIGLDEILITVVILAIVYFACYSGEKYGRTNPFDDGEKLKTKQEAYTKIKEIENSKAIKQKIESNLKEGL